MNHETSLEVAQVPGLAPVKASLALAGLAAEFLILAPSPTSSSSGGGTILSSLFRTQRHTAVKSSLPPAKFWDQGAQSVKARLERQGTVFLPQMRTTRTENMKHAPIQKKTEDTAAKAKHVARDLPGKPSPLPLGCNLRAREMWKFAELRNLSSEASLQLLQLCIWFRQAFSFACF